MSSSLREFRVAKTFAPRLGGLEGSGRPRTDYFALVLGDRGQDVDGQLVRVRVIDRDELYAGIHQRRDECQITGQAIEFGNDQLSHLLLADRKRLLQFWPVVVLTALDLGELPDEVPPTAVEIVKDRLSLSLKAQS